MNLEGWVFVYCVSYVYVVSGLCDGLITRSKKFYRMCVSNYVCGLETSKNEAV